MPAISASVLTARNSTTLSPSQHSGANSYVLQSPTSQPFQTEFSKNFTPPFHGMNQRYRWLSTTPSESLAINSPTSKMKNVFTRYYNSVSTDFSKNWSNAASQIPSGNAKVTFGIYWQALVLFMRRVPLFTPKNNSAQQETLVPTKISILKTSQSFPLSRAGRVMSSHV